jgi:hypothetical protein
MDVALAGLMAENTVVEMVSELVVMMVVLRDVTLDDLRVLMLDGQIAVLMVGLLAD